MGAYAQDIYIYIYICYMYIYVKGVIKITSIERFSVSMKLYP